MEQRVTMGVRDGTWCLWYVGNAGIWGEWVLMVWIGGRGWRGNVEEGVESVERYFLEGAWGLGFTYILSFSTGLVVCT